MMLYTALLFALCSRAMLCNSGMGEQDFLAPQNVTEKQPERKVIRLLTLLPYFNPIPALNPSWMGGNDVLPAMTFAVDQVNSDPRVLENYTLELVHGRDGCGVVTETALGFVDQAFLSGNTGFTGMIGPGCSSSVTLLARILNQTELALVTVHGGGSPDLSDRTLYPYLLGTLGSTDNFVEGFNALMRKSRWKRMALLYDDSRLYYLTTKRLFVKTLPANISLLYKPVSFNFLPLNIIRDKILRVLFVMCPQELTRRIMCLALHNNMIYPNYQFVIMSHTLQELVGPVSFTYDRINYECSKSDMEKALDAMLFINYNLVPAEGVQAVSDINYVEYLDYYEQYRELYNQQADVLKNSTYVIWGTYFYDAVWAWALVLDNLTKSDINFTINTDYGDVEQSKLIVEQFYRTSFQGMSGEISFRRNTGYTPRKVDILQVGENMQHHVASIDTDGSLVLVGNNRSFNFTEDSFRNATLRENRGLGVFFTFISAIHLSVVVFLHIITVVYRKKPSIKATSPKLLHMSYAGVYCVLLGTFLWSLNPAAVIDVNSRPIFCNLLWTWLLPIGFTLAFCPVAMRTWRIYRIFKHYLNPGKLISDPILIGFVVVFLVMDLTLSIIWTAVDYYMTEVNVFMMPGGDGQASVVGIRIDCVCDHTIIWLGAFFSYKIVILFAVAIFAFLTRKIANRSFATTTLRVLVFLLAIVFPLGFSIYFVITFLNLEGPRNNSTFITLCLLLNGMGALFVVCVFIPPLIPIFRKYKKKVMVTVTSNSKLISL